MNLHGFFKGSQSSLEIDILGRPSFISDISEDSVDLSERKWRWPLQWHDGDLKFAWKNNLMSVNFWVTFVWIDISEILQEVPVAFEVHDQTHLWEDVVPPGVRWHSMWGEWAAVFFWMVWISTLETIGTQLLLQKLDHKSLEDFEAGIVRLQCTYSIYLYYTVYTRLITFAHVWQQKLPRNEFLDDVFMFCPGDLQTIVTCPELLGQEPDTYNLPSKDHGIQAGTFNLRLLSTLEGKRFNNVAILQRFSLRDRTQLDGSLCSKHLRGHCRTIGRLQRLCYSGGRSTQEQRSERSVKGSWQSSDMKGFDMKEQL